MGGTKDYRPQDAVVRVNDRTSHFDLGIYVLAVLRAEWRPQNTDGFKPQIHLKEDTKGVTFGGRDFIEIYDLPSPTEPVSSGYGFENSELVVALDIHSAKSRQHMIRLLHEIRRILHGHRADPLSLSPEGVSGRRWLQWKPNQQTFNRDRVGQFRQIGEVRTHWRYRMVDD
jgi:hypothetical protein